MRFWSLRKRYKQLKRDIKFKKSARFLNTSLRDLSFFENHSFNFSEEPEPEVSIIIPVHNQLLYTLNCLCAISECNDNVSKEIILVNDCSTDNTQNVISQIKGILLINNTENLGFLKSANTAIRQAKGSYIYLLNNDTKVHNNYLTSLLSVFQTQSNVGAVGSKLIFGNNSLQEAGCLVFKNKVIVNRGATQSIDAPQFNFLRTVDYVSGCSLLFKRQDSKGNLNLFDEVYAPAYYEENDLCMRLKHRQGLDTYYQPQSEVIHYENVSYQKHHSNKHNLIKKNSVIFYEKWQNFLENIWKEGDDFYRINDDAQYDKCILVAEEYMPKFDQDSGSNRFTEIIKILVNNNHKIYLLIKNEFSADDTDYIKKFQDLGVEVIREYLTPERKIIRKAKQLQQIKNSVDYIWIFRPEGYEYYNEFIKPIGFRAKIIYDMVDLHYLRFSREKAYFFKNKATLKREKEVCELERKAFLRADAIVAISDHEKEILAIEKISTEKIFIVSNIHSLKKNLRQKSFHDREGLIFIGSFLHKPNVDSVLYLHDEIMPLVWKQNPDIKVYIVGGNAPEEITTLDSERFRILGYQKEIDNLFTSAKAMVAPLRYGAGVKGKIGQALEYQLPVISTKIGVEGMKLTPNIHALVAEISDPEAFANYILDIYSNEKKWIELYEGSKDGLQYFSTENQEKNIKNLLEYLDN